MGFAQRIGAVPTRTVIQVDDLDDETRTAIWNVLHRAQEISFDNHQGARFEKLLRDVWSAVFHLPLDQFNPDRCWGKVKARVLSEEWFQALDVTEYVLERFRNDVPGLTKIGAAMNSVFEHCLVGYRLVDGIVVPVTEAEEVAEIEAAVSNGAAPSGARAHLKNALGLLSDRQNPNYAKSLSESISAVEATVQSLTGAKVPLGEGLKLLEKKGYHLHPALTGGWLKLYGYTSDSGGIRHASLEPSDVDEKLASYFLVSCSAFVNLLTKMEAKLT
ncbi:AbiJ-NTD4 domain-containing protein [Herbiconiux sp. P17]|uniref:AbiJ-NTD4 domain-containing protein n=1 Tax=Herbiconiux wuyangfengii TaxID=3342794 RepID=UPI0035B909C4